MDHFNVTVQKDGALVATRRGMQVSKHKYHGISFVNASVPVSSGSAGISSSSGSTGNKKSSSKSTGGSFSTFSVNAPSTTTAKATKTKAAKAATAKPSSSCTENAASTDTSAPEFVQPLPHRWKFVTKTAAAAGGKTGKTAKARTEDATTSTARRRSAAARRTSPAVSEFSSTSPDTTSSPIDPSTPLSFVTSSAFHSPPSTAGEFTFSLSPLSGNGTSPKHEGLSPDCEAEFISPSVAALHAKNGKGKTTGTMTSNRRKSPATRSPKDNHTTTNAHSQKQNQRRALALIENSCQNISRSLPTWEMCRVPLLNDGEQRIFHQFFQLIPRKVYPFEDLLQYNPARSSEFYWMVVQDRAAVRCVLMCGAMFRAVLGGQTNSTELAHEVANVCGIVNEQLARVQLLQQKQQKRLAQAQPKQQLTRRQQHQQIPSMTLECITTLALMGGFTGRYDHWHVHMRGLLKIIEMNSGGENDEPGGDYDNDATMAALASLRPSLLAKMRKTDLKGAIALGTLPYLPFARTQPNASEAVLSPCLRDNTMETATTLLQPCGLRPIVVDAMGEMCIFVQAAQLASDLSKTTAPLPLDPYAFAEELHWIMFRLVSQPGPLRKDVYDMGVLGSGIDSPESTASNAEAASSVHVPVDTSRLKTENYIRNHQVPLTAPIVPSDLGNGIEGDMTVTFLEPAVRICALLYLKEFIPDFPRNLGGYAILLHLLRHHLGESLWGDGSGRDPASPNPLLSGYSRAVLLWVCLVGDRVSRTADVNEQRMGEDRYDRSVFKARLEELVASGQSITAAASGDTGLGESMESLGSLNSLCSINTMSTLDSLNSFAMTDMTDMPGAGLTSGLDTSLDCGLDMGLDTTLSDAPLDAATDTAIPTTLPNHGLNLFGFTDGLTDAPANLEISANNGTTNFAQSNSLDFLPESDWLMCQMLELNKIHEGWNDRQALLDILDGR